MPADERTRLGTLVKKTHSQGKRIRFWAIPNTSVVWEELLDAGVDLINVDRLSQFRDFYAGRASR